MKKILELIRVKHWIKNFLIFVPIICSAKININNIINVLLGFFAFSFMSSFIYIVNDIRDIEKDKIHPRKKKRPLPSGLIKKSHAKLIALIMIMFSLIINLLITKEYFNATLILLISYMIINISYSFGMKNIAILDIALLSAGFILRVYYGAAIIDVAVSNWLFLTILNASLFLGLGKRKKELIHNKDSRKVLDEYNESFLDKFQYLTLSLMLVFYSLWTIEQNNHVIVFTIPLLMFIFMKYSLIIEKNDDGDPTTIIYQDKILLGLCLLFAIAITILLLI